jgi:hypothetical protein
VAAFLEEVEFGAHGSFRHTLGLLGSVAVSVCGRNLGVVHNVFSRVSCSDGCRCPLDDWVNGDAVGDMDRT